MSSHKDMLEKNLKALESTLRRLEERGEDVVEIRVIHDSIKKEFEKYCD